MNQKNNSNKLFKKILLRIYSIVFILTTTLIISSILFLEIGQDTSLKEKFFIKNIFNNTLFNNNIIPKRQDFVLFNLEEEKRKVHSYINSKNLIKKVGCISGDYLEIIDNKVYCNNELISIYPDFKELESDIIKSINQNNHIFISNLKDDLKEKIQMLKFLEGMKFQYSSFIPQDYVFLIGTNIRSYDSKYFGLVNIKNIKNSLIPVSHILSYFKNINI